MEKERIQKMPEKPQAKMAKVRARVQKHYKWKKVENNVKTGELQRLQRKRKPVFFSAVSIFTFTYPLDMAGTIRFWVFGLPQVARVERGREKLRARPALLLYRSHVSMGCLTIDTSFTDSSTFKRQSRHRHCSADLKGSAQNPTNSASWRQW